MKRAPTLPEVELAPGTRVIADLHLDPGARAPWRAFQDWLERAPAFPALIVLGDLFEYWIGAGQAEEPEMAALLALFARRARAGMALHFLHGNRDFLLGRAFERAVGGRVHPFGLLARVGAARILFLHGDELATRDRAYQRLRRVLRSGPVRGLAEVLPPAAARALARGLRQRSRRAVAAKTRAVVELQSGAAREFLLRYSAGTLVCGHAHRLRDEALADGLRWIVLDAFGGAHDVLCLGAEGRLELVASAAG